MAIKDIFTMIKADRYTSDGREELIKAQEAVTEDVTYKPGDISRKTGLQKQPDGSWAPVKNAPAQKKGLGGKTLTKGAKHYPTVGEYAENGPIEQRMAMKKLLEKNDTESGSGLSERAQYSVSQTAAGLSTEALKSHVDKLKNDPATRNAVSNPDAMAKAYEAELAKRGETITKMSDLVAQKSRPESAPSGRQPTPEMLEREKMRKSPEAKARRDKLDAEHPRTETGAPMFETEQENAQYARGLEGWDDVNPERLPDIKKKVEQKIDYYKKYDPYAMLGKKTGLTAAQKSAVQQNMAQAKENLAFYTGQLEGINKKMGGDSNDSAPRILTGDCKVRIKKSK